MRRLLVALIVLFIPLIVTAQDDDLSVRTISITSVDHLAVMSPDGRLLAVHENGVVHNDEVIPEYLPVRVYDLDVGEELYALDGPSDYATSIAFNNDGSRLATYHRVGWIYVWDMTNGELISEIPALPHSGNIAYVPGTNLLVQADDASLRGNLMVWDTETGYIVNNLVPRFANVNEERLYLDNLQLRTPNALLRIFPLSDGETIYTPTLMDSIMRWNLNTGEVTDLLPIPEDVRTFRFWDMAFSADEQTAFFTDSNNDTISQIDLATGEILTIYDIADSGLTSRGTIDVQGDIAVFITLPEDGAVLHITPVDDLYGGETYRLVALLPDVTELPRTSPFLNAQLSADGKRIVVSTFIAINEPSQNFFIIIDL